jgi:hypothetical protein
VVASLIEAAAADPCCGAVLWDRCKNIRGACLPRIPLQLLL